MYDESVRDHIRATRTVNTRRATRQLTHDRLFNKESVDCSPPFSIADWDGERKAIVLTLLALRLVTLLLATILLVLLLATFLLALLLAALLLALLLRHLLFHLRRLRFEVADVANVELKRGGI